MKSWSMVGRGGGGSKSVVDYNRKLHVPPGHVLFLCSSYSRANSSCTIRWMGC